VETALGEANHGGIENLGAPIDKRGFYWDLRHGKNGE
jgi:hypothetical protein